MEISTKQLLGCYEPISVTTDFTNLLISNQISRLFFRPENLPCCRELRHFLLSFLTKRILNTDQTTHVGTAYRHFV